MCPAFRLFNYNLIKAAHHILLWPSIFFLQASYISEETRKKKMYQTLLHFPDAKTNP